METSQLRTCQTCARAKIKCQRTNSSTKCNRCLRLGKECFFRQARQRVYGPRRDRFAEERENNANNSQDNVATSFSETATILPTRMTDRSRDNSISNQSNSRSVSRASTTLHSQQHVTSEGEITQRKAMELLNLFRGTMAAQFPFVVVPPSTTADQLSREKPFLYLTILAAASHRDLPLQRKLNDQVRRAVSDRMIFGDDLSFDMLQGLLIHLAWFQFQRRPRRFSQILHLAISIIVDRKFDRHGDEPSWKTAIQFRNMDQPSNASSPLGNLYDLDVQRAVAGLYYLSSTSALFLQKSPSYHYNASISSFCKSIGATPEVASDKIIPDLINLQHILEKIDQSLRHGVDDTTFDPVLKALISVAQEELESFREQLSYPMNDHPILEMHFHAASLYLHQISLLNRPHTKPQCSLQNSDKPNFEWRRDALISGLTSAIAFFAHYRSLPHGAELGFNNLQWMQLGFSLIVACKLCVAGTAPMVFQESKGIRNLLDMPSVLNDCITRVETLTSQEVDHEGDRDVFYHYCLRGKKLQKWFEKSYIRDETANSVVGAINGRPQPGMTSSIEIDAVPQLDPQNTNKTQLDQSFGTNEFPGINSNSFLFSDAAMTDVFGNWFSYDLIPF